jgi:hypothetical protein
MVLSWHHWILGLSALSSYVGLCWLCAEGNDDVTDAEAIHQTLFRMAFATWLMYCAAALGTALCPTNVDIVGLRVLSALSYLITFCCVLGIPLHSIEQLQQKMMAGNSGFLENKRP